MSSRGFVYLLVAALALSAPAGAERRVRRPATLSEPVANLRSTTLLARDGSAIVTSEGRRTRVRLRRDERLLEIAETADGWAAAGVRDKVGGGDLLAVRQRGGDAERLPSPARGGGLHRSAPRLLVDRGNLAGLAWLEGERPDRMAVRAARWNGAAWIASEVVAPPAAGSQTGLAQAVLPDGSWLLVWSLYDGRENELYWSREIAGGWSRPAPVERADGVPDVTPTLLATATGALLAWSEYDGRDYRLRGARFAAGGWSGLPLDAGPGALRPRFAHRPEGTWVLIQSAVPRGWAAIEIAAAGGGESASRRLARVETGKRQRPLLRAAGSGVAFEWAGARGLTGRWETIR